MFSFVTLLIILSDVVLNACTTLCIQCEGVCLWLPLSRGWLSVIFWNSRWRAARTPGGPGAISAACRQMCPGSSQLEVLIPSTETDLHTELRPPFITAGSWLSQVTRWDCACHPGHTLCQLKLFFISWMIDSSLIVLLLFFPPCVKHGLERGNVWIRLLLFLKGKRFCRVFVSFLMMCSQLRSIYGFNWTCYTSFFSSLQRKNTNTEKDILNYIKCCILKELTTIVFQIYWNVVLHKHLAESAKNKVEAWVWSLYIMLTINGVAKQIQYDGDGQMQTSVNTYRWKYELIWC